MPELNDVEEFVVDIVSRAGKTFVQAAVSTGAILWAGSGLDVTDLVTVNGVDKAWSTVAVGALGAGLSATWNMLGAYFKSRKATKAEASPAMTLTTAHGSAPVVVADGSVSALQAPAKVEGAALPSDAAVKP